MEEEKSKQISEEQLPKELIEAIAYTLWKARQFEGRDGTPEGDWEEAREYIQKHRLVIWWWKLNSPVRSIRKFWGLFREPNSRDFALEVIKTLGIGLTALGLLFSVWKGLEDRRLTQERLITERFSQAVQQLEKEPTVRIGGIYALERIAEDSSRDHWTIMEVLTSYIRKRAPLHEQGVHPIGIDIKAALTVIGRRQSEKDPPDKSLDLSASNLFSANLKEANLERANLENAILYTANLEQADLREAELEGADLKGSLLRGADLRGADLRGADLRGADLRGADLRGADLRRADLKEANLRETELEGADFWRAINLTDEQVKSANNWQKGIYDTNFRQQLELLKANPSQP